METTHPRRPISYDLWTDEAEPRLIGGRRDDGEIIFPFPSGDAAQAMERVALSRSGLLWSWTLQGFEPKEPYCGPKPFTPYMVGYVELPGEVIVESRLVGLTPQQARIGMAMRLAIIPFDDQRTTYAFRPDLQS